IAVRQLVAWIEKSGRCVDEMRRMDALRIHFLYELIRAIVEIRHRRIRFPPYAQIQRQARRDPECIAEIEGLIMTPAKFDFAIALLELVHQSQNVIGLIETSVLSVEPEIGRATSELQSLAYLVCRLLLEKKKNETIVQNK